jgi:hypothetical protein
MWKSKFSILKQKDEDIIAGDILIIKFGFYNLLRINSSDGILNYEANKWYQIDILINWEDRRINFLVDRKLLNSNIEFFDDVASTNTILISNLSPGSKSRVANLKVCSGRCFGDEGLKFSSFGLTLKSIPKTYFALLLGYLLWQWMT